jgi:hypothetical protein
VLIPKALEDPEKSAVTRAPLQIAWGVGYPLAKPGAAIRELRFEKGVAKRRFEAD